MKRPTEFHKYTTLSTALVVLRSQTLRWSSPELFDDPAEFKRMPPFEPDLEASWQQLPDVYIRAGRGYGSIDISRATPITRVMLTSVGRLIAQGHDDNEIHRWFSSNMPNLDSIGESSREYFERLRRAARVLCISSQYDDERLWSDYGESGGGCILSFQCETISSSPFREARQVRYMDVLKPVGSALDLILYGGPSEFSMKTIDAVIYTKAEKWSHQKEWRMLTVRQSANTDLFFDSFFLTEELFCVTLGRNVPPDAEKVIQSTLRSQYPGVDLRRM